MSSGEVNKRRVYEVDGKITLDGLQNSNAKILPIHSVMIALNGQGKTKGTVATLEIETTCNQSLAAFLCDESRLHYNYLFYYLDSTYREIRGLVGDDLRDGLSLGLLKSLYVPFPPIPEQCAVAAFLDRETAKIDALIERKERLIVLLQEKRAALISHAVTKGLYPAVPIKDSGVEWIGEIPAHWEVKKLKYVCSLIKDGTHQPPERVVDGIPLLSVRNIVNGRFVFLEDDSLISENDFRALERAIQVRTNDVLLAIVGATLGKVAIVNEMAPFSIQRSLALLRGRPNELYVKFLTHLTQPVE